jgi:hypothetical protein
VLSKGRTVPKSWKGTDLHGLGGGPEECIARLQEEGVWDDDHRRARPDREIDAAGLEKLEPRPVDPETPE